MSDRDEKAARVSRYLAEHPETRVAIAEIVVPALSYSEAWKQGAIRGVEFSIETVQEHALERDGCDPDESLIEDLRGLIEVVRTLDEPSPAFVQTPRPPVPALVAGTRNALEAAVMAERERCLRIVSHAPLLHTRDDEALANVDKILEDIRSGK